MSTTLSEKTAIRRRIDREWSAYLSPSEHKCVTFIFSATIDWGRTCERLKRIHFVEGIGSAGGTGLCARQVQRCLDSLEEAGAIFRKRTPYGYVLGLNPDWDPSETRVPKKASDIMAGLLKTPKRLRESGQIDQSRVDNLSTPYTKEHTLQEHTSCPSAKASDEQSPVEKNSIQDRIDGALAKASASKAKAAARVAGKYNPAATTRTWMTAFREAFPEATLSAWTARETGQAKLFLRDMARPREQTPALEILDWCVRSWRLIMTSRFAWMESGTPELPVIGFMLAFKDRFYDAWNQRNRLRQDMEVSGKDRMRRRLQHRGLTAEEAENEVQERIGLAAERQKLAEERERLNKLFRQAEKRPDPSDVSRFERQPKAPRSGPVQPKGGADDFE